MTGFIIFGSLVILVFVVAIVVWFIMRWIKHCDGIEIERQVNEAVTRHLIKHCNQRRVVIDGDEFFELRSGSGEVLAIVDAHHNRWRRCDKHPGELIQFTGEPTAKAFCRLCTADRLKLPETRAFTVIAACPQCEHIDNHGWSKVRPQSFRLIEHVGASGPPAGYARVPHSPGGPIRQCIKCHYEWEQE